MLCIYKLLRCLPVILGVLASLAALPVSAETSIDRYPERPVRLIISFPPGGGADIVGRLFADKLSQQWGQTVVVDNRAGAGGVIGTEAAARAEPDGYTVLLGTLGTLAVNPHLYPLRIDPLRDLAPVGGAVAVDFVLVANTGLAANSVAELVGLAKQAPGEIHYSSSGIGGGPHLAGALFNDMAGVELAHVPYKGSAPSFGDLLGARVSLTFDSLVQALPHIRAEKLKALAVLGTQRSALLPDVPTMAEAGIPGYEFTNWFGFVAPAGTPREIIQKLNAGIQKVQSDPDMRERLTQMGAEMMMTSPEALGELMRADTEKWGRIIKQANIQP